MIVSDRIWAEVQRHRVRGEMPQAIRLSAKDADELLNMPKHWMFTKQASDGTIEKLFSVPVEPQYATRTAVQSESGQWKDV